MVREEAEDDDDEHDGDDLAHVVHLAAEHQQVA
jgi:hypothetical protein